MKTFSISIFMLLSMLLFSMSGYAEDDAMPEAGAVFEDVQMPEGDVEIVLETLNETLVENRKIRGQLKEAQEIRKTAEVERNVLESQIRRVNREIKRVEDRTESEKKEMKKKIEKLEMKSKEMEDAAVVRSEQRMVEQKEIDAVRSQNERLEQLLTQATFSGEVQEYRALLDQAKMDGDAATMKVRAIASEHEAMVKELAVMHYEMGNIMFNSRDFKRSATHYERSIELDPTEGWAHYNLGVIYDYYMHDDETATFHYREYLKLKPIDEEAGAIRERLLDRELSQAEIPAQPLLFEYERQDGRTFEYGQRT